jgi:photosystem II stability/assembly factor-like uncharacterized protein
VKKYVTPALLTIPLALTLGLALVCSGCKKDVPLEVYLRMISLQSFENSFSFSCELEVIADKYDLEEVGVLWGTSPDLANLGTRKVCAAGNEYNGALEADYATTYYVQPYAVINGENYTGDMKSVTTGHGWAQTAASPGLICTQLSVSPAGIVHVFGTNGKQYYSSDKGATWISVAHINSDDLSHPKFINEDVVFLKAEYTLRKSTNGGMNWTTVSTPTTGIMHSVFFYDDSHLFYGRGDSVYSSVNGGLNWTSALVPAIDNAYNVNALYFISPAIGYALTSSGEVAKTTNSGTSWTLVTATDINTVGRKLWFTNENTGFAGISEHLYYTSTGGFSWTLKYSASSYDITEIDFCDALNGVVVANSHILALTSDGGQTWLTQDLPGSTYDDFLDVDMANPSLVYTIDEDGKIYIYR